MSDPEVEATLDIDFSGLTASLDVLRTMMDEPEVREGLLNSAIIMEAGAKEELQKMVYDIPESPGYKRTRNLFNSTQPFGKVEEEDGGNTLVTGIKSNVHYAPYVHFGTKRGMKPRPYMSKGITNVKDDISSEMADSIAAATDRIVSQQQGGK